MKVLSRACLVLAFVFAVVSAFAADSGSLRGTVIDQLGAVVPNAGVALLRDGKQIQSTKTSQTGAYQFSSLPPGRYQVRAEAVCFDAQQSTPIYVGAGRAVEATLTLTIGSVAQNIVVSATGKDTPESQVGASVAVVTRADFQGKMDIFDPLRQVPGVQTQQNGQRGVVATMFVRGGNSNANKVLIDGVPVNELGGLVNFGTLATTGIEKAEVFRGPNSALFGSDAMAGVVNLTTRRGSTLRPELAYSFDAGNFNSWRHDGSLAGAFRQLDYFSEFARSDTGNSEPNSSTHNATYAGNFGWAVNPSSELRLTVRNTSQAYGLPNALDFFGIANDEFAHEQNLFVGATFQNQTTTRWHNLLRYGATRLRRDDDNPTPSGIPFDPFGFGANFIGLPITIRGANGFIATGQAILDFGGTYPVLSTTSTNRDFLYAQSDYNFIPHLAGLFGFRYEKERGSFTSSSPKTVAARDNFSYIGEVHGSLGNRFYVTLGGALEDNALFGTAATPRVSLAFYPLRPSTDSWWNGTKLKFNYGQGIKEPGLFDEAFSLFDVLSKLSNGQQLITQFHVGPIAAERSRSWDAGVEQLLAHGRAKVSATFFHNQFTNQIEFVDPSALPLLGVPMSLAPGGAFFNSSDTRALGAETAIELNLGHGFSARGSYTYLDNVVQRSLTTDALFPTVNANIPNQLIGAFSPLKGGRPFRRAPHSGSFFLIYHQPKITVSLSGYLVSRRDDSTFLLDKFFDTTLLLPNRNLAPAYQKIDFNGGYQINPHLALFTTVENLGSQHYDAAFGFPTLPLTFRTGMKVTLGGESPR